MHDIDTVCLWIAEFVPLVATLFSLIYGLANFFKKGMPIFLQSLTMAMASYCLSVTYHLCQTLISEAILDSFTPAYLGRMGLFMFLITYPQQIQRAPGSCHPARGARYYRNCALQDGRCAR